MPHLQRQQVHLLPVEPEFFFWRGHRIALYRNGTGEPLLLIHSINAAASAFEMRKPFSAFADQFEVYALDLLGYGESDRPARRYQASDYIALIIATLERIGRPTTILASSLGAAYAIAAAAARPDLIRALILFCPTGIKQLADPPGPAGHAMYQLLRSPVGHGLFKALTSRASTRYFLQSQAYANPASIDEQTLDGFYRASHEPGAIYAPICFLSGLLNCRIDNEFAQLTQPILLIWGRQATTTPVTQADTFLARNQRAELVVVEQASLLVQDEQPETCQRVIRQFLGKLYEPHSLIQ
jgi:pimeloyl-ACP methyl ester carboxylesterase